MSRDQIMDFVEQYGFILWSTERGRGDVVYHFMDKEYGINLWVNADTLSFWFEWMIPNTIFRVKSPELSPLSNKKHFEKMLERFKDPVMVLYRND